MKWGLIAVCATALSIALFSQIKAQPQSENQNEIFLQTDSEIKSPPTFEEKIDKSVNQYLAECYRGVETSELSFKTASGAVKFKIPKSFLIGKQPQKDDVTLAINLAGYLKSKDGEILSCASLEKADVIESSRLYGSFFTQIAFQATDKYIDEFKTLIGRDFSNLEKIENGFRFYKNEQEIRNNIGAWILVVPENPASRPTQYALCSSEFEAQRTCQIFSLFKNILKTVSTVRAKSLEDIFTIQKEIDGVLNKWLVEDVNIKSTSFAKDWSKLFENPEQFGFNNCSKSMELIDIILSGTKNYQTHFRIPKAYFLSNSYNDKDRIILFLSAYLPDISPACESHLEKAKKEKITFQIYPSNPEKAMEVIFEETVKKDFQDKFEVEEGYKVFQGRRSSARDQSYEELLLPIKQPENFVFITCRSVQNKNTCEINQKISESIWIKYTVPKKELKNFYELNAKTISFVNKMIVKKSD